MWDRSCGSLPLLSPYSYRVVPAAFLLISLLFSQWITLVRSLDHVCMVSLWTFFSVSLICHLFFPQYHTILITVAIIKEVWKLGSEGLQFYSCFSRIFYVLYNSIQILASFLFLQKCNLISLGVDVESINHFGKNWQQCWVCRSLNMV